MYSHRMLTGFVLVIMLFAGCSGGGGDTSGESSSGDSGNFELSDPEAALRDAGSFTVTWRYGGVDPNGVKFELIREFYADLPAERSYTVTSSLRDGLSDGGSSEQFVADGVTYMRSGSGENVGYASYEGTTDVVGTAIALSQARAYGATDDLTFRGTETFNGVTVSRYELSDANGKLFSTGQPMIQAIPSPDDFEITDFEYVVLVDERGLSRYESWSYVGQTSEGDTVRGEWEYSLTEVGSTNVDDPDWLAEAKSQSGN